MIHETRFNLGLIFFHFNVIDELFNFGKFQNSPTQLVVNLNINYHDISLRFFASPKLNNARCRGKHSVLTLLQGTDITI